MFLILGLFVYFLYTFVFDPRVGRYEQFKMCVFFVLFFVCFFFYQYYIWDYIILSFNTTEITHTLFTNYINISRIYLRLKKRYLKSLKIVIRQLNNSKLDVYADHIYHIELEIRNTRNTQMCIIPLPTHRGL